ncbi:MULTISPECIES: DMT family transporter [unclassified Streptomyces]|uniref:DMT family transporter n=1 Tax=unclassified Streptomyces TaxID=2593676 RepID=UPI0020244DE0|nr:DMT family transporter [Streptomyces sp. A 4/2]WSV52799.1 DMT family transporter [Streptomyces sp. NBC_01014]
MNATLLAVGLSLLSAVGYATAAVAQERLASRTRPKSGLLRLLGRGAWWWAVGLNAAGAVLHVVALKYGPLTLVQPLGALTLVAAVPLGARLAGRRVSRIEWRGTVLTLLGLGALLLTTGGTPPHETLSLPEALGIAAAVVVLVSVLVRRAGRPGARPGLRFATASGVVSGVASALTQTVTVSVTDHTSGVLGPRTVIMGLLVAAFAVGGLLLSQTAYREGLGAPLAMVTLANPVAASVIGLALLGERLQGGAVGLLLALVGAAAAARGVVLLTRATVTVSAAATPAAPRSAVPAPDRAPASEPLLR